MGEWSRANWSLDEYTRLRDEEPWAGLTASAGGGSVSLADPALAPLWKVLDEDGRTLLLHPGTSPDPRLTPFYLSNLLGNPAETALAAATASVLADRGQTITLAQRPDFAWSIARQVADDRADMTEVGEDLRAVQNVVEEEFGADFPLSGLLAEGVGIHHRGLPDDIRVLTEYLMEIWPTWCPRRPPPRVSTSPWRTSSWPHTSSRTGRTSPPRTSGTWQGGRAVSSRARWA
ncbi:hypothetical protein [Streptomyces capitiformicae]|uniref:Uncharacterized protein n=1 Tax=Streptomyces capitiformicae TaxID=2014920 RepID=A0A918YZR1_9ACTN|nr:hypothetical protein [Streptomyces capitiformicae]GHE29626.1 hypothetical protein GCM10017771_45560 [Streptomyces capitiformicae]